ncbi:TIGR03915 family putative DNA repair protein [Clostridium sp. C8]|uniref:TIGR03915 family putative DNA repair protein n=1 Tax=Clostridium sp. C8 TaxID=1667357 RepID=UPI00062E434D|nr:TIGR03915 family putative DNA repair protein [Clostridium sp. C8]KLE16050.1 DNA metabolism protein [Clostridium sp. C8]
MLKLVYEDSFEGFLTAIYYAFYSKTSIESISTEEELEINLLSEIKYIDTDLNKYNKVKDSIVIKIDPLALNKIYKLYLSNYKNKGTLCYKYLKIAFKLGSDVHKYLHLDAVKEIDNIERRVSLEAHRFNGFVRFISVNNNFLYSSIEPDNNILEIISPHFQNRFSNEYWIIHDVKRGIASIYDKISWEIREMDLEVYNNLKDYNDDFQSLWKGYFKSTTIEERINPKLQKRMMPKRYWNNLTEINYNK